MAKRRLIKKINEVSDEELAQETFETENEGTESRYSAASNEQLEKQDQEIKHLRELLEEYRLQEAEFEQERDENFRLSQQNKQLTFKVENDQKELEKLTDRNDELEMLLNQKEAEISELKDAQTQGASEEVQTLRNQVQQLQRDNEEAQQQISSLEAELLVKNKELDTRITEKEQEIKQLNADLLSRGSTTEKQEALETVKMELEELNKKLHKSEDEKQALTQKIADLQQQLAQLQEENSRLNDKAISLSADSTSVGTNGHIEELKKELEAVLKEKSELEVTLGRIQALNDKHAIQKNVFEAEVATLRESYKQKEEELESVKSELNVLQSGGAAGEAKGEQLAELLQAKQQINDLLLKNQSLQEDALKSQQEIGEVMVSAKKEANRIISEAQVEAKHMINSAELEMLNIGNRAKNISNEVEESKNEIMSVYRELEERLSKLSRLDKTGN
ncbi:hypothetical protein IW492_00455 [Enterococcus sp. BWB1-3]|uniref:hypothetical protein n=1 Tax=unclassified Enterococcus TaxID=2608891 RepID=UPI001921C238|nr:MULTISPECIES: hypothetical protein [unclassified Enterococcus]MBL1227700.1 hypothetical protein [Enterococcus sp. BWB1-3]MCB5954480.1 hypothetical protein [Enterococcus sp. CWB-B31]